MGGDEMSSDDANPMMDNVGGMPAVAITPPICNGYNDGSGVR
jgi:hypothetical protein